MIILEILQGNIDPKINAIGTFVSVTHSQSEAFAMADRVVIMSQGVVEQIATSQAVFRNPATRFVAGFAGSRNIFTGRVEKIDNHDLYINVGYGEVVSLQTDEPLGVSSEVDIVISADRLKLNKDETATTTDNSFSCTVVSEEFVVAIVSQSLGTGNGTELKIQKQQMDLEGVNLEAGQKLWVSWPKESVYITPVKGR